MDVTERERMGEKLALLLNEGSSGSAAKLIAKKIGFKLPFFGGGERRALVEAEVASLNTALIIHVTNQMLKEIDAKPAIDHFLLRASRHVFKGLEARYPAFLERLSERLAQYFQTLSGERPELGLSFSLIQNLGRDPIQNLEGQLHVLAHISAVHKEAAAIIGYFSNAEGQGCS